MSAKEESDGSSFGEPRAKRAKRVPERFREEDPSEEDNGRKPMATGQLPQSAAPISLELVGGASGAGSHAGTTGAASGSGRAAGKPATAVRAGGGGGGNQIKIKFRKNFVR
eukprot:SAG22_NODE_6209_length_885_cov_1.516539_1_plen_110_part_10